MNEARGGVMTDRELRLVEREQDGRRASELARQLREARAARSPRSFQRSLETQLEAVQAAIREATDGRA